MIQENDFKKQVAKNLVYYRKLNKMTQNELAQKLNYSDKAISKWERGENLPDLYILQVLANIYGVTLNDLASEVPTSPKVTLRINRLLITILSMGLIWLIATVSFVLMILINKDLVKVAWLAFIYAIPISLIILIVFSCIWGNNFEKCISISAFAWSIPLAICLTAHGLWYLFICIAPLQILIILWFVLIVNSKRNKNKEKTE